MDPYIKRTEGWLFRWRAVFPTDYGLDLSTTHITKLGARLSLLSDKA
jgi:hypothetical protein